MDRPEATGRGAAGGGTARAAAWLCATVALGAVLLAGCGSVPASSTGAAAAAPSTAPATASPQASSTAAPSVSPPVSPGAFETQAALCQHTATVTGLEIMRNHVMRVPQPQAAFPDQVTVATPASARAVARAVCGLPTFPAGFVGCPALIPGTTYLLRFTADGRLLPAVSIESTGCEIVTGVGPVRWAAKSPGFWRTLAVAAHRYPPGRTAFGGGGTSSCQPQPSLPGQANGCPAQTKPNSAAVP